MKKFIILLLILLPIITSSCRTTRIEKITLPPRPQRQELLIPKNTKECAEIILYYHSLVKEWEAWGDYVENTIGEDK